MYSNNMFVSNDPTSIRKSVLVKCANALIAKQELSGPQVASYLLGFGDHYTNIKFRSLFWLSFESYLEHLTSSKDNLCNKFAKQQELLSL